MKSCREVLPVPIYESVYEELVGDFEPQVRALIARCGLDWDARCASFFETERAVGTPSKWQVRQPIYGSSVGSWRKYERHLGPLKAALGRE